MGAALTLALFPPEEDGAGSLGCAVEIQATVAAALARAAERGVSREQVAERMGLHLGEARSRHVRDGYAAPSHPNHEINLRRAMAFDAALGEDVLLSLYARKRGGRRVITHEEAALLELGRIHQAERELAERRRALQSILKTKGEPL